MQLILQCNKEIVKWILQTGFIFQQKINPDCEKKQDEKIEKTVLPDFLHNN